MKKIFLVLILGFSLGAKAQFGTLIKKIERLEKRRGLMETPITLDWNNKKFIHIQSNSDGIVEKKIFSFLDNTVHLMEVYDDEKNGSITTTQSSGDFVFTKKNILSIRLTKKENDWLPIPQAFTFLLNQQEDIYYLIESISKQKWIDQDALSKQSSKKK